MPGFFPSASWVRGEHFKQPGVFIVPDQARPECRHQFFIVVRRLLLLSGTAVAHRAGQERLPTSHSRRIELRDAKMWRRETQRLLASGNRTSRCPCTLCLFGRPLLRATQAKHLRDYGRHPAKRLQSEVKSPNRIGILCLEFMGWSHERIPNCAHDDWILPNPRCKIAILSSPITVEGIPCLKKVDAQNGRE